MGMVSPFPAVRTAAPLVFLLYVFFAFVVRARVCVCACFVLRVRLERNRRAARNCRLRKKERLESRRDEVEELTLRLSDARRVFFQVCACSTTAPGWPAHRIPLYFAPWWTAPPAVQVKSHSRAVVRVPTCL